MPSSYPEAPREKRFRSNVTDLFLTNSLSATRCSTLLDDAEAAGAQHISDLSRVSRRPGRNKHRDLLRVLAKRSQWPKLYYVPVRCWNNRLQTEEVVDIPVALPHEVLHSIGRLSDTGTFASTARLTPQALSHYEKAIANLGGGVPVVPLGLRLDGTPCNWDRIFVLRWLPSGIAKTSS